MRLPKCQAGSHEVTQEKYSSLKKRQLNQIPDKILHTCKIASTE